MLHKLMMSLGKNALDRLGSVEYLRLWINFIFSLGEIWMTKDLRAVDKRMSRRLRINYKGHRFIIDCAYIDKTVAENSYTFGLIREIYIKDCYFKYHKVNLKGLRNVVDLGSNRGVFSLLAANFADKVLSVERQPKYNRVSSYNMGINGFNNQSIENIFIGGGGLHSEAHHPPKRLEEILGQHGIESVDFLKIDIEGNEFRLFEELNCLNKIKRISMEVHSAYGHVEQIVDKLKGNGFELVLSDDCFRVTSDMEKVSFLYAWRA